MSRRRWTRPFTMTVIGLLLPLAVVVQPSAAQAAAAGNPKAYALDGPRWNPCAPITYRVNLARSPKNSLPEVKKAFANIAAASGLRFRYAGTTTAVPEGKKAGTGTYPTGTDIVVAWASPNVESEMLPARSAFSAGRGGWDATWAYTSTGAQRWGIYMGKVVLNTKYSKTMARGFGAKPAGTTGQLLMHEIGHAVGLDHPKINDKHQIMYPQMTTKKAVWGAGDLVGLRKVGKSAGCLYPVNPKDPPAGS